MRKTLLLISIIVLLTACTIEEMSKVCYQNNCFYVEIADTLEERTVGLMHRTTLPENQGMLFIFETVGNYAFWMKDTKIPLDMIWIDENNEIVYINKDTQPCTTDPCENINPRKYAKYVLEINAGTAEKIGLEVGSKVDISLK